MLLSSPGSLSFSCMRVCAHPFLRSLSSPSHLPAMHTGKHHEGLHTHKRTQKLTCKGADRQAMGLQVLFLSCATSKEDYVGPPRIACCQNRQELCCLVTFGPVFQQFTLWSSAGSPPPILLIPPFLTPLSRLQRVLLLLLLLLCSLPTQLLSCKHVPLSRP